jgi:phosphatidylglycerophosphate synthase
MMAVPWQIPDSPLRSSVAGANLVGLVGIAAAAWAARVPLNLSDGYLSKSCGVFALTMLIALGFVQLHHPFNRFGAANVITTLRAAMVALVGGLVGETISPAMATTAAIVSAIVVTLDGLDGWTARRTTMASAFGARFDMEIDALLILVLSTLAWRTGKAGPWVLSAGLLRYAFVASGWMVPRMRRALPPSRRRQAVCVALMVGLSLVILPIIGPSASAWLAAVLVAMLVYSFLVDTLWLLRHRD